jgi:hypothetical protein
VAASKTAWTKPEEASLGSTRYNPAAIKFIFTLLSMPQPTP